jgi:hypothetical protein
MQRGEKDRDDISSSQTHLTSALANRFIWLAELSRGEGDHLPSRVVADYLNAEFDADVVDDLVEQVPVEGCAELDTA